MTKKAYDSDLTDEQWKILEPLMNDRHPLGWGRPRSVNTREVVNAICYVNKTGCQWRSLPHDFPSWPVVFYYFNKWRKIGLWKQVNHSLTQQCREKVGRDPNPTAACIDSQSVKGTSESGGEASGFDGGKKVNGRKRHIVTETMGYVLGAMVHAANEAETTTAPELVAQVFALYATLLIMFADLGYKEPFRKWLKDTFNIESEVPEKEHGFKPARKRWVVERTFAWISRQRRMARDYERTPESSESLVYISMIRIMLKQLSPVPNPWRKGEVWSPLIN
jgi:putative transposase